MLDVNVCLQDVDAGAGGEGKRPPDPEAFSAAQRVIKQVCLFPSPPLPSSLSPPLCACTCPTPFLHTGAFDS